MTFAALNAAVVDLRNSLTSFAGGKALAEITVRPPSRDNDEASFLRLVSWSYVLLFEAGRVSVPYLIELPSGVDGTGSEAQETKELVHDLRTWSFHNLGLSNSRGLEMSRNVQRWFVKTCQQCPPEAGVAWQRCFLELSSRVQEVVEHCQGAMTSVLSSEDDGEATTQDLQRRVERTWMPAEFHKLVSDAAYRLGITVDCVAFTNRKSGGWREYLECLPWSDDPVGPMERIIERDLLDHAAEILPLDGRDIMNALDLEPGPEVGKALHRAREVWREGVRDRAGILKRLMQTRE